MGILSSSKMMPHLSDPSQHNRQLAQGRMHMVQSKTLDQNSQDHDQPMTGGEQVEEGSKNIARTLLLLQENTHGPNWRPLCMAKSFPSTNGAYCSAGELLNLYPKSPLPSEL